VTEPRPAPEPNGALDPAPAAAQTSRSHPSAGMAMLLIVGGGFLTQILTTVTGILSARMLGVDGRGQLVLVASLAMLTSQLTFGGGLPNAVTRQLADHGVTARDGLRHLVPRWTAWSLVPSALAGGYFLLIERDEPGHAKFALAAIVLVMALQLMMSKLLAAAMLGEGADLVHVALTSVLPQALVTLVIGGAFVAGVHWNPVEISLATMACIFAVLLGRLRLLKPATGRAADALEGPELYRVARRFHVGSIGPIDGLSLDRTLVGSLLGSTALGLYSVAFAMASVTTILGGCLAMVVLPRVTVAQRKPETERQLVRRWLLLSAAVIVVVVLVLELVAGWAIRVAFGNEFVAATTATHWLIAAGGVLDFRRVLIAVLQGRNVGGQASVIELALTPIVVVGIVLASVHDSLTGVSLAMLAVGVLGCLLLGAAVLRSAPGSRIRYVGTHSRKRSGNS
jgi:O-antigen/teichoic acid export membrane protein